jgi:hypothetical protein
MNCFKESDMKQLSHSPALLTLAVGGVLAAAVPGSTSTTSAKSGQANVLRGGCSVPGVEKYCTTPPNLYSHCGAVFDVANDCNTSRQFENMTSQWDSECVETSSDGWWIECRVWDRPPCLEYSWCNKQTDEYGMDYCISSGATTRMGPHVKYIEKDNYYIDCPINVTGSSSGS